MEAVGTCLHEPPPKASAAPRASPSLELQPPAPEGMQNTTARDLKSEEEGCSQLHSAPSHENTMTYLIVFGGEGHMVLLTPRPSESVKEETFIYLH